MWEEHLRNGFNFGGNRMENKKSLIMLEIILLFGASLIVYCVVPSILDTIFNIGKDVGEALAKWF